MEIHHENLTPACKNTSLTQPFAQNWSLKDPQSYPWWRRSSAIKTKPGNSIGTLKKNPFLPAIKPKTNSIKESEKNPSPEMEIRGGYVKFNETTEKKLNPENGFSLGKNMVKRKPLFSAKSPKPRCNFVKKTNKLAKDDGKKREWVLTTLEMFRVKCAEISKTCSDVRRIDTKAFEELKKQRLISCTFSKILGHVPGVVVGDRFRYRIEIYIVGLHGRIQHGIDYMPYHGRNVATCVVAKEGHCDIMTDSEVITYIGEGGIVKTKQGDVYEDQKLVRGNRALVNSMLEKTSVRVVRGVDYVNGDRVNYVYDGLYKVVSYEERTQRRGVSSYKVFEFKLKRCPGQPVLSWQNLKNSY